LKPALPISKQRKVRKKLILPLSQKGKGISDECGDIFDTQGKWFPRKIISSKQCARPPALKCGGTSRSLHDGLTEKEALPDRF
jgi:hypothetical protein